MQMNTLVNGDCEGYLAAMSPVQCIIADPPDNLGLGYDQYADNRFDYYGWIGGLMRKSVMKCNHFWLSYYHGHDLAISSIAYDIVRRQGLEWHKYLWRFTFGQHKESDCGSGYRTILRLSQPNQPLNTSSIRVPSLRQTLYNDPRANPAGRVPDDVWEFPRVTGNSRERRSWHPTQHPVAIYARIMRLSTKPGDQVVDLFGGTGTLFRANHGYKESEKRLCTIVEISEGYCAQIALEHGLC